MRIQLLKTSLILALAAVTGCGFLREARVCEEYCDTFVPNDEAALLVTWPIHLGMLAGCAAVDQSITTFECIGPAGRDSYEYLTMKHNKNNIMLDRTIAVPRALATPLIFTGSYTVRWMFPVSDSRKPFDSK